ncbi:MAG: cupin domain-containing protein [Candidatus Limivivens sp.]|nr:cupin domain-containing protein [Candidatus Limivivens sp.]
MNPDRETIEQMITKIIQEKLGMTESDSDPEKRACAGNVRKVGLPWVKLGQADRLETGKDGDQVFTHDLFSLSESPRLGCGLMEMERTTFDWTLNYDEIDYVIEGTLTIRNGDGQVTAEPGEVILIPRGSKIQFSVPEKARFLYVTYPADWENS